jgi:hypothetical protein
MIYQICFYVKHEFNKLDVAFLLRKDTKNVSSLIGVLAEGHERITELGPHLNEDEMSLIETVQSVLRHAITVARLVVDSTSESMQHSDPPSPSSDILRCLGSSDTTARINPHQEALKRRYRSITLNITLHVFSLTGSITRCCKSVPSFNKCFGKDWLMRLSQESC